MTVTLAVPCTPPLAAVTVKSAGVVAENRPAELIEPPPLTDQVESAADRVPFWS